MPLSRSGARGLGQLMPGTAAALAVNARDASDNLRGTSIYLRALLDRFHGQQHWFEKAIAGYNAGPTRSSDTAASRHMQRRSAMSFA